MSRSSRLDLEGRSYVVTNASRVAVDAAASCARGAGRAGSPCEPVAACGRAALKGSSRQYFDGYVHDAVEPCGENGGPCVRQNRVVLAVVATVKLSRRCVRAQPGGQHRQFAGRGRPEGKFGSREST